MVLEASWKNTIKERLQNANQHWDKGVNPVKKMLLSISGSKGKLYITTRGEGVVGQQVVDAVGGNTNKSINVIQHHVVNIEQEQQEMKVEMELLRKESRANMVKITRGVQRLTMAPTRILGQTVRQATSVRTTEDENDYASPPATLGKTRKTCTCCGGNMKKG